MIRFGKLITKATLSVAVGSALLGGATPARAEDCVARDIQCMIENGGSTQCLHEYIRCIAGQIRDY